MIEELYILYSNTLKLLNLSQEQIDVIILSKFKNNEEIFTVDNVNFFYNFCGYIEHFGYDTCIPYLNYISNMEEWNDELLFTEPNKLVEDINRTKMKFREDQLLPVLKGLYKCRRCGSNNVFETQTVTRGDEEAYTRVTCVSCGYRIK